MKHPRLAACLFLLLPLRPAPAEAQAPGSFADLPRLLEPDTRVVLTLVSGKRVRGRLEALERDRLAVREGRLVRWLGDADIARIDRRTIDSLLNGILLGAAVGGGIFLKYQSENALCQVNCQFVSGAVALIAGGAALGAAIDALAMRTTAVYERGAVPAGTVAFGVGQGTGWLAYRMTF